MQQVNSLENRKLHWKKALNLYTIIIRSPKLGESVLPIAECISNDGTATGITYFVQNFFET